MSAVATATRTYAGQTASQRADRRREQLLAAGLEAFAADGWSGATVLGVCRRAGVSQRSFYAHFADREALFVAVCEQIGAEVQALVRAAATAPGQTPRQRAHGSLAALADHLVADPRRARVALVESFGTPVLRATRAELLAALAALGARLMRALHPRPERADERSLQLSALVLTGGMAEVVVAAFERDAPVRAPELVDHLTLLFEAAATVGPRSAPPPAPGARVVEVARPPAPGARVEEAR